MFEDVFHLLERELDRERLKQVSLHLYGLERGFDYCGFAQSARYCHEQIQAAGLAETQLIPLRADGVTEHLDFIMPQAWEIDGATLSIVSPSVPEPILADRRLDPMCVANRCPPTPPEGITAQVVTLEAMRAGADVRGKIVFTPFERIDCAMTLAADITRRGAAAIISGGSDGEDEAPRGSPWINGWGYPYWYHTKGEPVIPCFSVSPSQVRRLARLMRQHAAVTLKAVVNSRLYDGEIHTVTGVVAAPDPREIVLLGHLYEPFIPDNSSGAAAILEIGRMLTALTARGALPPLKRRVRLLLSMEQFGMAPFFAGAAQRERTITAVNVDSISYDVRALNESLRLCMSPHSLPFFGDFLLHDLAETALAGYGLQAGYEWADNDNFVSDSTLGIPSSWVNTPTGKMHHNSADELDHWVDWNAAAKITCLVGAYAYALATVDGDDLGHLLRLGGRRARAEVLRQAQRIEEQVRAGTIDSEKARERLRTFARWHSDRLCSVERLKPGLNLEASCVELAATADTECARMGESDAAPRALTEEEGLAQAMVVRRVGVWAPASESRVPAAERFARPADAWPILNWCDGKRDLGEVLRLHACDTGREITGRALSALVEYFRRLERYGYVKIVSRKGL